jgi:Xaa-Pro aminopeptidase
MAELHEQRRARVRQRLAQIDADAALVTRLVNVRYLTGFTGSNGALLVADDNTILVTDGRYETQVTEQAPDVELVIDRELVRALLARAAQLTVRRLAFEDHHLTVAAHDTLLSAAGEMALVRLGHTIEALRAVKDATEIDILRTACATTDAAYADMLERVHAGMSEREIAWLLETSMRDRGAEAPAFETIVASGVNGAVPHHRAADRPVSSGDLVTCDFGAKVDGYHADMTRTFAIGQADDWQRELYGVVAAAQEAGRVAATVNADCRQVDAVARSVVDSTAYAGRFVHGLGHGVGLEVHEAPWLGQTATGSLTLQNTVTIEPGVYLPGRGGVRIEDSIVVRDGPAELLTRSPRELIVI